jgi:hypothetical protein
MSREKWSPEDWAWKQIHAGKLADFHELLGQCDPKTSPGWDDRRRLSTAFLRNLKASRISHNVRDDVFNYVFEGSTRQSLPVCHLVCLSWPQQQTRAEKTFKTSGRGFLLLRRIQRVRNRFGSRSSSLEGRVAAGQEGECQVICVSHTATMSSKVGRSRCQPIPAPGAYPSP